MLGGINMPILFGILGGAASGLAAFFIKTFAG